MSGGHRAHGYNRFRGGSLILPAAKCSCGWSGEWATVEERAEAVIEHLEGGGDGQTAHLRNNEPCFPETP